MTSKGLNRHITCLSACRPLNEYAWFAEEIRRNLAAGMELDKAVDGAIDNMPDGYELKAQIMEHKAEGARCPGLHIVRGTMALQRPK